MQLRSLIHLGLAAGDPSGNNGGVIDKSSLKGVLSLLDAGMSPVDFVRANALEIWSGDT